MAESTSTEISLDGHICIHAKSDEAYYPYVAAKANSFTLIAGPHCGRGWVLLLQRDVKAIQTAAATFHTLKFKNEKESLSIGGLVIVRAERVTTGGAASATSLYLVEIADKRWLLERWADPVTKAFNLRRDMAPFDGGFGSVNNFWVQTLNSGILWTWQTMLNELWLVNSTLHAGSDPSLPYTPHTNPDSFVFPGVSRWNAVDQVLRKLSCAVIYNPMADAASAFTYAKLGTMQSGLSTAETKYRPQLKHDFEPLEFNATKVPSNITVILNRHQPHNDPYYKGSAAPFVNVTETATSVTGAIAPTALLVYDDLRYTYDYGDDTSGNPGIPQAQTNADASARIAELVANHKADLQTVRQRRIYQGICADFRCGSQVKVIQWRHMGLGAGMECEVVQGPGVPRSIEDNPAAILNSLHWCASENLSPPDVGRWTWPRQTVLVGKTDAGIIAAGSSGPVRVYSGQTFPATAYTDAGSGYDLYASNLSGSDVAQGKWVVMNFDGISWIIIFEDCD